MACSLVYLQHFATDDTSPSFMITHEYLGNCRPNCVGQACRYSMRRFTALRHSRWLSMLFRCPSYRCHTRMSFIIQQASLKVISIFKWYHKHYQIAKLLFRINKIIYKYINKLCNFLDFLRCVYLKALNLVRRRFYLYKN